MLETTLAYLHRGGCTLLLHRVKKENDVNQGKWIGVGGKLEPGETPEACMCREVQEETGLTPTEYTACGVVDFASEDWTERMYLYSVSAFTGAEHPCEEGELAWIPDSRVLEMPTWAGDRVFLKLMARGEPYFRLKLEYEGENLRHVWLNGKEIDREEA